GAGARRGGARGTVLPLRRPAGRDVRGCGPAGCAVRGRGSCGCGDARRPGGGHGRRRAVAAGRRRAVAGQRGRRGGFRGGGARPPVPGARAAPGGGPGGAARGVGGAGVDVSVDGEWSFAQTLRHLVLATDAWLGRAVLGLEHPFHPLGQAGPQAADDGLDLSLFVTGTPAFDDVLDARAGRVAMVRDVLARVTEGELAAVRSNPWSPQY